MSYPIATANAKVTIRSLVANSPGYSVPLTAAVTYVLFSKMDKVFSLKNIKIYLKYGKKILEKSGNFVGTMLKMMMPKHGNSDFSPL